MTRIIAIAAVAAMIATPVQAGTRVVSKSSMSFDACRLSVTKVGAQIGRNAVVIMNTDDVYMAKFYPDDGQEILVTCSRADGKRLITATD